MQIQKLFTLIFSLVILANVALAQETAVYTEPIRDFRNAQDLFDKEKYSAAQKEYEKVIRRINNVHNEVQVEAEYFHAVCALELFNKDAEYLLSNFIRNHPESARVKSAYYQLGRYQYRRKKYKKALDWFDRIDTYDLAEKELSEFYFKRGYSHFMVDHHEAASKDFYQIKDAETEYRDPARYYYSHIAYEDKNYQTALQGFEQLKQHKSFGKVVPYYIAQIYYLQRKYDELIAYAIPILDSASVKREAEISRMIGESYYRTERYGDAVPYLERYHKRTYDVSREDNYQLGFAYYKSGAGKEALKYLNLVTSEKDLLTQTANYHIGDAYLGLKKKPSARNAFREASKLDFDKEIQKNALYNYAKLSYELSYDPYHEAILAFESFINNYPNAAQKDEAYSYLLNVYMTTKNYQKALQSLDRIKNKDFRLKEAYQMVAFNSGVEQFVNRKYEAAIDAFTKVKLYPINPKTTIEATYWIGECFYQKQEYENAIVQYQKFQGLPQAILHKYYNMANYNIAYSYHKKKQYDQGIVWFRKFANAYKYEDRKKLNDAYIRIGDSYYIQGDYNRAVDFYDQALAIKLIQNDYVLFNKGMSEGLQKNYKAKEDALKEILSDYTNSNYKVRAKYELGETFRTQEKDGKALKYYRQVVDENDIHPLRKKSLLHIAQLQYRANEVDNAISSLKQVLDESSILSDAQDALIALKNYLREENRLGEYEGLVSGYKYVKLTRSELDSVNYSAALGNYEREDYLATITSMTNYLGEFDQPIFETDAHYYRADSYLKTEQKDKALEDLQFIIALTANRFTEDALAWAAILQFEQKDYQSAVANFISLEKAAVQPVNIRNAQIGQMRCFFHLGNHQPALTYAEKVLANSESSERLKLEARMIRAKCNLQLNEYDLALKDFLYISEESNGEDGADAQYEVAYIYHIRDEIERSDEEIRALVKRKPSYNHWLAMGYLLLAENAIIREDYFQAKATLQSIIDYHDGPDLVTQAESRLAWIIEQEQANEKSTEEEKFEVEIEGNQEGLEKLFNEETEGEQDKPKRKKERKEEKPSENETTPNGNSETPEEATPEEGGNNE